MPSMAVKLYSLFFKLLLKHRLQGWLDGGDAAATATVGPFDITSRLDGSTAPANPSFCPNSVATKDIHINPLTSLSLCNFLPDSSLLRPKPHPAAREMRDGFLFSWKNEGARVILSKTLLPDYHTSGNLDSHPSLR